MKVPLHVTSKWATARQAPNKNVCVWNPVVFANMNQSTQLYWQTKFFLFTKQCTKPKHVASYCKRNGICFLIKLFPLSEKVLSFRVSEDL